MIFDEGFALMLSIIGRPDGKAPRRSGMVLEGDEYHHIVDCRIESEYDELHHQTSMRMWAKSEIGRSTRSAVAPTLIPCATDARIPRATNSHPDHRGDDDLRVRTRRRDETGMGMTEYLDQVVDGVPIGPDYDGGVA